VETAEEKKKEGNELFKSGSYADALSLYVFFFCGHGYHGLCASVICFTLFLFCGEGLLKEGCICVYVRLYVIRACMLRFN
jgi:hypothetical protein